MVPIILARWCSAILLCAAPAGAQTPDQRLAQLVTSYRESPSPQRKAAIVRYASAHPKEAAQAHFALGVAAFEQKDYPATIRELKLARVAKITDYTSYYLNAARVESADFAGLAEALTPLEANDASPLRWKAYVVAARALAGSGRGGAGVKLLKEHYSDLPQPNADLAMASAYEAAGDLPQAAYYYQRVYYWHPTTDAAVRAAAALVSLRERMGPSFPKPTPKLLLDRADRLLSARDYSRAKSEYREILDQPAGAEKDFAAVRAAAADLLSGSPGLAFRALKPLTVSAPEADAERLYYIAECARRMGDDDAMLDAVKRLGKHEESPWRLKALIAAGNRFLVSNQPDRYEPLFKAAVRSFPSDPMGGYAHWKVVWLAYLSRKHDARDLLREHLEKYPRAPTAGAALYFLGRLEEDRKDYAAARAYYSTLIDRLPNYYYGVRARARLAEAKVAGAGTSEKTTQFLSGLSLAVPRPSGGFEPTPATKSRVERARILRSAGFADLAESELRFGVHHDGQPALLAMEAASGAPAAHEGLRLMKRLAPDYLITPMDQTPRKFWQLLFPMPYRQDLVRSAQAQNLDPYMVAGLIRQESEFDPKARSHANAYGLTQVVPATGRASARRNGLKRFSTAMLYQPAVNLKLGTYYLRTLLDQWGGKWEPALASYNAGKTRVNDWIARAEYREPAEFVESIPFTETRDYVQAVMRNGAMYRQIWGTR